MSFKLVATERTTILSRSLHAHLQYVVKCGVLGIAGKLCWASEARCAGHRRQGVPGIGGKVCRASEARCAGHRRQGVPGIGGKVCRMCRNP